MNRADRRSGTGLVLLTLLSACTGGSPRPDSGLGDAHQSARPDAASLPGQDPVALDSAAASALPDPAALEMVVADTAYGRTGPGDRAYEVTRRTSRSAQHLQRRIGPATFAIALRTSELVQFPCSSCHTPGARPGGDSTAHQNIEPVHPAETGAECRNCHVPAAVDRLRLASGETAGLDQAYRLCAPCHAAQVTSWTGGAHGKRLDGWRGRRVVMNCADCHDPHRPGVPRRIPYPGPRLPPRQGGHR